MAQPIQVPQTVPNAPQYQVPTDLVNAYLARKQQSQQFMDQSAVNLGETVNKLHQQKIQNQLAALQAYAGIAKAVGPDAANQVAGQIPNMPSWNQNIPQQAPVQPPQTPPQMNPGQPIPQTQGTPSTGISAADTSAPQDVNPSAAIHASVAAGAPDITGHVQKFQSGQVPPGGTTPLTDLSPQIATLNNQMGQYRNKGDWGMQQQKQLSDQIAGLKAQQESANAPEQFVAGKAQEANQFAASQAAEKGRARAGVAEKVTPTLTAASQLEGVFNQMSKINADPNNKSIPFTGDLGAKYAKMNPSTTSKWALNQAQAESQADVGAGAIEKLVEGRYNDQQMARIKDAMFPTGNELGTPRAQQKLDFFKQYVQQMKTGSINQANAAMDSIAGGSFSPSAMAAPINSPNIPQNIPTISNDGAFNALPSGSQFKDPSGQLHTKK